MTGILAVRRYAYAFLNGAYIYTMSLAKDIHPWRDLLAAPTAPKP